MWHKPRSRILVTEPISLARPDHEDRQRTMELEKLLAEAGLFGSNEEAIRRQNVLGMLDLIVKNWVKQLTWQRGYTNKLVDEANAIIFTFGSYRLGVKESFHVIITSNLLLEASKRVWYSLFYEIHFYQSKMSSAEISSPCSKSQENVVICRSQKGSGSSSRSSKIDVNLKESLEDQLI